MPLKYYLNQNIGNSTGTTTRREEKKTPTFTTSKSQSTQNHAMITAADA
jgi:hypothetical protein